MAGLLARGICLLALLYPLLGNAVEIYRYRNEKGQLVLSHLGVPPQFAVKGYEVLNEQGRMIKVIPPPPSEAELKRQAEEKAQASADVYLLESYSTEEDIERALQRKLKEIDLAVAAANGNLNALKTQQRNLQGQAAAIERAGGTVPDSHLTQMERIQREQRQLAQDITRFEASRVEMEQRFSVDRARLAELLSRVR